MRIIRYSSDGQIKTQDGVTLDGAYDYGGAGVGAKVNADSGTVEIEVADNSNNYALLLDMDDSTNNPDVLVITNAGTGADIYLDDDGEICLDERAAKPGNPPANAWSIYAKSDGIYCVEDDGTETGPFGTGGNTLDQAYDQGGGGAGRSITADNGAVEITVTDNAGNYVMSLVQNDSTQNPDALVITNAGTGSDITLASDGEITMDERAAAPGNPPANAWSIYFKSDGMYYIEDDGTEVGPLGTGGGAGLNGCIVVTAAEATNIRGDYGTMSANTTYFSTVIPSDFSSLESANIVVIGIDAAETILDIDTDYAADDEQYNNHSEQLLNQSVTNDIDDIYFFDISGALTNLAAGDALGVKVAKDTGTRHCLALIIEYS